MNRKLLPLLLLIVTSNLLFSNVEQGELDLRGRDFINSNPLNISGEWAITYEDGREAFIDVPGKWDGNYGEVTYTLKVLSDGVKGLMLSTAEVNTEYQLKLNGKQLTRDVEIRPLYIPLNLKKGENLFEFKIKNYTDLYSGFRNHLFLGNFDSMVKKYELNLLKDTMFSGSAFIMGIFFLILFVNFKKDRSTLYFSLLCIVLSIRGFVTNDKIIFDYIPELPYWIIIRFEYFTIYILPILIFLFIKNYFNQVHFNKIFRFGLLLGLFFAGSVVVTPPRFFISLLTAFYFFVAYSGVYAISALILYKKKGVEDAGKILISIISLAFAAVYDALIIITSISERLILTNAMVVFILFMSYLVSRRDIRTGKKIDRLSLENIKVNEFLSKFVPNEFIRTVGMGDITELKLGDGVEKDMVVLFASIKDFQLLLKVRKAEDTIKILNITYDIIAPIITAHGGFIDKFIDETVMALFPGKVEDAIDAVLEIKKGLDEFNKTYDLERRIDMMSGIHIGKQYIGIVGDDNRIDATVISKEVNTASRINNFTGKINRDILISEAAFELIEDQSLYKTTFMGSVKLKGKENFIGIYAVYLNRVPVSDLLFSRTIRSLDSNKLEDIGNALTMIKYAHPDHAPSIFYLNLIKNNKSMEVLEK